MEDNQNNSIDTNLEFLKYMSEVIKKKESGMNSDYVLARLSDQDKEGVVNRVSNAFLAKMLIKSYMNKKKWVYENNEWKLIPLEEKELKKIANYSNEIFNTFMIKANATVIMNRNVKDNFLIRLLLSKSEQTQEEEQQHEEQETSKVQSAIKNILKKKGGVQE